jgi:hypothetical protein
LEGNTAGLSNYNSSADNYVGNDVQAIDLAQQAGDLGFFSLALPIIVEAILIVFRGQITINRKDYGLSDTLSTATIDLVGAIEDTFDTISFPLCQYLMKKKR